MEKACFRYQVAFRFEKPCKVGGEVEREGGRRKNEHKKAGKIMSTKNALSPGKVCSTNLTSGTGDYRRGRGRHGIKWGYPGAGAWSARV